MNATISQRLDALPISPLHRKVSMLIGIGIFFDLFDIFLSGVLSTVLIKQFHTSPAQIPLLIGSSFLGMFFGAIVLNNVADRLGRRKGFLLSLGIYSLFTFMAAFSPNTVSLVIFRFLAGVGLGAELPLSDSYLSEMLPASKRGRFTAWAYTFGFVAVPIVGFLSRILVPMSPFGIDGWRWIFIIGSLGAVIVWALRRGIPESPRWLYEKGRYQEAHQIVSQFEKSAGKSPQPLYLSTIKEKAENKASAKLLFHKGYGKRTAMLWIFQILQTIGYYGFGSLVPIVLAAKGYTVTSSLEFVTLSFIGYPLGSLLSIGIIDKIDRKWLIVLSSLGMSVFGLLFGLSDSSAAIITFGFLYTTISNIFSNSFHTYQAEIFPTQIRATAAGYAYSLSRLTSGLMPFVMVPVLRLYGATAMFGIVATAMVLIMITIAALGPKTTGKPLEVVNQL